MAATPIAYLRQLAGRLADIYRAQTQPRAVLLTGSAALGLSDQYSDLDLILYYDTLPSDEQLQAAREAVGATEYFPLGPRTERECAEDYMVAGVECQVAHVTIAAWEADMARVLVDLDVASPLQKAIGGLLEGRALLGDDLIQRWRATAAAYPDALAEAMVRHYLTFFPAWYIQDRLVPRDAHLWLSEMLVEGAQHILGVLAGLNHLYFTPFQFKRLRAFTAHLASAPPELADRLDSLFTLPPRDAISVFEDLVHDVVALVAARMPAIDTSRVRRRLGQRQQPWSVAEA